MLISKTFFIAFASVVVAAVAYHEDISPSSLGFLEEKLTHIRFFFHDVVTGPNATIIIALSPLMGKSKAPLPFGSLVMLEDPLTEGPEPDSKLIGKAQGFYTMVTQREDIDLELVMGMTITFTSGKFNGSTLSLFGRNYIFDPVREMPIVGGTGTFRFARGFVRAKTYTVDYYKGDAIVEYNVYVFYYANQGSLASSLLHHHQEGFSNGFEFMTDPLLTKI
ncbi:hypothetical protein PIB30_053028 [Stylosanthes scabra]|uniref:Dirigent protein n=1 Tax=Stylosanthes scabra TaxID=79078 RepID=A0ABU6RIA9_9FABA|nr:hypothetical protein [Stylosanthes scabra]